MKKLRTRAGVAALATAATVGALVVPLLVGAQSASAAAPTALTVTPSAQAIDKNGAADFVVTVDNGAPPPGAGIWVVASSGPDAAALAFNTPQPCPSTAPPVGEATCHIVNGGSAGTDNLIFFYAQGPSPVYTGQTPSVTGTLTVAGAISSITVSPASAHQAQGMWQKYTINATDVNGNAKGNHSIKVTATETSAKNANLKLQDSPPNTGPGDGFQGIAGPSAGFTASKNITVTTCAAEPCANGVSVGQAVFWVNSQVTGTVNITANSTTNGAVGGSASLTVNPGAVSDVTQVILSPAAQTTFEGVVVTTKATVENAQGDVVGDRGPAAPFQKLAAALISGPNVGDAVNITPWDVDKAGVYTLTYTTHPHSGSTTTTGVDDLQVWQQELGGTVGKDAGEAFADAMITVVARPTGIHVVRVLPVNPTENQSTANTTTQAVFEVEGHVAGTAGNNSPLPGYLLDFSVNSSTDPVPSLPASKVSTYTVTPDSGVSGADGRVSVTITDPAPRLGDRVGITASLSADSTLSDTFQVRYTNSASQYTVEIQPYVNTSKIGTSVTHTATTVDGAGNPVSGITYIWQVTKDENGDVIQNGAGASFSYTDARKPTADHTDDVTVVGYQAGLQIGSDLAPQYWVRNGSVDQLNGDLGDGGVFAGKYKAQGVNPDDGPFTPSGFVKENNPPYLTTADPTATTPFADTHVVAAMLADVDNNRLHGQDVTFTSSGVGTFTDANGKPIGTSITTKVDDGFAAPGVENGIPASDPNLPDRASAFVRSTQSGVQTITITAGGVSDVVLIHWGGQFVPITPIRVYDTRTGAGAAGGCLSGAITNPGTKLNANTLCTFPYANTPLPTNASAYVFNVTAIHPNTVGNLRVGLFSSSTPSTIPATSLVNYVPGKDVANSIVLAGRGGGGLIGAGLTVYSDNATVDVAVDLEGYYTDSGVDTIDPALASGATSERVGDTRTGIGFGAVGPIAANTSKSITVTEPSAHARTNGHSLKAVLLNVTAIHPSGSGNLRVYPDGAATPTTSNINYIVGQDKAAFVVVKLPANGKIDVFSDGSSAGVAVDVYGYLDSTNVTVLQTPARAYDTRTAHTTIAANGTLNVPMAGVAGVPADAQAVLVSLTAIHAAGSNGIGNLRAFPTDGAVPNTSVVNYLSPGTTVANFAYVAIGVGGAISLHNDSAGTIDAAVDVLGYIPAGA